jgi:hypothetical protein
VLGGIKVDVVVVVDVVVAATAVKVSIRFVVRSTNDEKRWNKKLGGCVDNPQSRKGQVPK